MGQASNKQTQQPSLSGQSVKCILAGRAYIKNCSPTFDDTAPLIGKIGEGTHAAFTGLAWTDLGAVMKSKVGMTYNKEYNEVRSGLDGVFKTSYVTAKSCEWTFGLDNYDSTVLGAITGTAGASTGTVSTFSGYKFWIGKEDTITKQLLVVGTNKIDSKEHQYWCPVAELRFAWEEDGDALVIRVTALLRSVRFASGGVGAGSYDVDTNAGESFYQVTIWD